MNIKERLQIRKQNIKPENSLITIVLIIILMIIELNGLYYFLDYSRDSWVFLAVLFYPLIIMNNRFIGDFRKGENKFFDILGILFLSVACYIGLLLPSLNALNFVYLKALFSYLVLFFVMIYCINSSLNNVSWNYDIKKNSIFRFLIYFAISAVIIFIAFLACYPGLFSPDSIYILSQAISGGPYNNLHPLLYTLAIRFLLLIGFGIGSIMTLQCVMCALAYSYIFYSFDKMGLKMFYCIIGVILLSIYPMNLMNSISFWKDIPYTIGLSLLTIEFVKIVSDKKYFSSILNITVLVFAIFITIISRHNGILSVALVFLIGGTIYLFKRNKLNCLRFAIVAIASLIFYYSVLYGSMAILGDKYQEPADNKVTKTAMYALRIQGLISIYVNNKDDLTQMDREYVEKYLDIEKVYQHLETFESKWQYYSRTKFYTNADVLLNNKKEFNLGYIRLMKKYPYEAINAYLKTTGIVWAVPQYGYTAHSAYAHDEYSIDGYENVKLEFKSAFPKLKRFIQGKIRFEVTNTSYWALFWRPAIFMLILLIVLYHAIKKHGSIALIIALPALINSLGYLFVIEAQDARYVYINFTASVIMIVFSLIKKSDSEDILS